VKKFQQNITKPPFLAGVINIDLYTAGLEIFQINRDGDKEVLETLEQNININLEIFKNRTISHKKMILLCNIMIEFTHKLKEYDIDFYYVVISRHLQEASNSDILINRIKSSSGLEIELFSCGDEIRLFFELLRDKLPEKYDFLKHNVLSFVINSSSLVLMVSESGNLKFCESIPLDMVRSFDKLGNFQINAQKVEVLLESLEIKKFFQGRSSHRLLIGMGKNLRNLINIDKKWQSQEYIESASYKINLKLRRIQHLSVSRLVEKYNINEALVPEFELCSQVIKILTKFYKFKKIMFPPLDIQDALMFDIYRTNRILFENDIISVTESLGEKYNYDSSHAINVSVNSLKIFDKLQKKYFLDARSRLLLDIAAHLHDIGRFINLREHHRHSNYIINNLLLPGITENEQLMIAAASRCLQRRLPRKNSELAVLSSDEKETVNRIMSILQVGNMLDRFFGGEFICDSMRLNKAKLTIKTPSCSDEILEQVNTSINKTAFYETFGLKIKVSGAPGNYEV
jgi:exopolyphosphatase/guanosine-5'-triphosphate,3'-diphosphate pyrophosphatase